VLVTLVPEDTLSRQIRPISASLPMMKLYVSIGTESYLSLDIYIKVHGIRQVYLAQKTTSDKGKLTFLARKSGN